ncbi:DUF6928 family protein [Streptomyces sp. NPDC056580]|uniref:DUF6928 family protein n=1 Tax=Streptomyces sp. NPDC056580 TaxID=3345872 RepID=UPI0036CD2CA2
MGRYTPSCRTATPRRKRVRPKAAELEFRGCGLRFFCHFRSPSVGLGRPGEDALRALCGFALEGSPEPDDIDADDIHLHGFRVRDPHDPDPAEQQAALQRAMEAMGPPRFFTMSPDGSLIERDGI